MKSLSSGAKSFLLNLFWAIVAVAHGYVSMHLFGRDSTVTMSFTVLGALGIFIRDRQPWGSLLISLPGLFIADSVVAPLVALYTLAAKGIDNRLLALATFVVFFGYSAIWRGYPSVDLAIVISTYGLVGALGAVATGMLVKTRRDLSESMEKVRIARREEIERVTLDVQAAERTELAREMHDAVSHQVSLIAVQAGALQVTSKDEESIRAAKVIRDLAVKTIDELRQMVTVLRASGARSRELAPQFTLADIRNLVEQSGMDVSLEMQVPGNPSPAVQRAVYRAVQEGLANAHRYAPGASVEVSCLVADGELDLLIVNGPADSPPREVPSTRHGHVGLAERAELLNGAFEAGETIDGYQMRFTVPLA